LQSVPGAYAKQALEAQTTVPNSLVHFGGFPAQAFNVQGGAPHIGYQSQKMANTHGAQIVATNKLPLKQNNIYL